MFEKQIAFLEQIERDAYTELKKSIESNGIVIKNYVTEKQLFQKGVDGKGKRLKGYTRTTIRYKISKGQPADRTTTRDEGDFHASVQIDAFNDRFEVTSNVTHAKYLIKRYGQDILRPSFENMEEFFRTYFVPNLKKKINDKFAK